MLWKRKKAYYVKFRGRSGLTYHEGDKVMQIDSELLFDPPGMTIYSDSIQSWLPPDEELLVTEEDKKKIIGNINSYLSEKGYELDWA